MSTHRRIHRNYCLIAAFYSLCLPWALFAQSRELAFHQPVDQLGGEIGHSYFIEQDKLGFLYIGTDAGLYVYDGYKYSIFRHDPNDPRSLSDDEVSSIVETEDGTLWIGTRRGLDRFDPETGDFTHFHTDGSSFMRIKALEEAEPGVLWLGGGCGLVRFDCATGEMETIPIGVKNRLTNLAVDWLGVVWCGSLTEGVFTYDPTTKHIEHHVYDADNPQSVAGDRITSVIEDHEGRIWVATRRNYATNSSKSGLEGLCRFDPLSKTFSQFPISDPSQRELLDDEITALRMDSLGNIWIGMMSGKIGKLDPQTNAFTFWKDRDSEIGFVSSLLVDQSGVLWVGRLYGSVLVSAIPRTEFHHWVHDRKDPSSLVKGTVTSIYEDHQGTLWVGTTGGLSRLDSDAGAFETILTGELVSTTYEDKQGDFWITSYQTGLHRFDRTTNTVMKTYANMGEGSSGSTFVRARALWEDAQGTLWLGHQHGLSFFDRTEDRWRDFEYEETTPGDHVVKSGFADRDGTQWIATEEGIVTIDPKRGVLDRFVHDEHDAKSLSGNEIRFVYRDSRDMLWVGTKKGLNRRDPLGDGFIRYTIEEGRSNETALGIAEDESGILWLSTRSSIARYDPQLDRFTIYDQNSGLINEWFAVNSYFQGKDGQIYFGGAQGVDAFHPFHVGTHVKPPMLALTTVSTSERELFSWYDFRNSETQDFEIPYDEPHIAFEFALRDFVNTKKNLYRYRLLGLEQQWNEANNRQFARFMGLPPGDYVFEVQGANSKGSWNEAGASIAFSVLPLYWQTTWFRLMVLGFALALIIATNAFITSRIRKTNTKLKAANNTAALANEKLAQAVKKSDTYAKQSESLAQKAEAANVAKSQFLANMSHEIRTPLNGVMGSLSLIGMTKLNKEQKGFCEIASTSAQTLLDLLNDILDLSKIEAGHMSLEHHEFSLRKLGAEVLELASIKASEKGLEVNVEIDEAVPRFLIGDSGRLRQVLLNLLINGIKFTHKGSVRLRVILLNMSEGKANIRFEVEDTGIGIPKEHRKKVFKHFAQVDDSNTRQYDGAGLGLSICRQIIDLMEGEIGIESTVGIGTTVWFSVSLEASNQEMTEAIEEPETEPANTLIRPSAVKRVLIAEDNEVNQLVLASLFHKMGLETVCVGDGEDCLEAYRSGEFDMIMMDCQMPGLDGYEATRILRQEEAEGEHVPIIAVTAKAMLGDREKCLGAGMDDYISKPIALEDLKRIVMPG